VDWEPFRQARLVHLTGITPALGTTARALVERALREAATVSFDVNYRSALWSPAEARAVADLVLPRARHLFLGREEARALFGLDGEPERTLEVIGRLAPTATVSLLMGDQGSLTLDGGTLVRPRVRPSVQMVDPIGAGDAYVAGFLWTTLRGGGVQDAVDAGTAVAALKCSLWGDIAVIGPSDVQEVLAGGPGVRR
jgi:2-dehydro-3-deoxygluconokinase